MKRALNVLPVLAFLVGSIAHAQIPLSMSYQGLLQGAGGAAVADGSYDVTFRLYNVSAGGAALYTEAHTGGNAVTTSKGVFNVILGSITPLPLPFDTQYWLGISVGANPELTPRVQLTSSAYALNARTVVDGAITAPKIAAGQVVKSVNGLHDNVTLAAGVNVTITPLGQTLTIAASGGGGGLTLPFSGSTSSASDAFAVTNSGTGPGVFGTVSTTTATANSFGVAGSVLNATNGLGYGVDGMHLNGVAIHGHTNGTSANIYGVQGVIENASPGIGSAGVRGENHGTGLTGVGVSGIHSGAGIGVFGAAAGGTPIAAGAGAGVEGSTSDGIGVLGLTSGTGSNHVGVWGRAFNTAPISTFCAAVRGDNYSTTANGIGVMGTQAGSGYGLYGTTATGVGIYGETGSTASSAKAIYGVVTSTSPGGFSAAVRGDNSGTGGNGIGVYGSQAGSGYGIYGTAVSGWGVVGTTAGGASSVSGVWGQATTATPSLTTAGVRGDINSGGSTNGVGVLGVNAGAGDGVLGQSSTGIGVEGTTSSTGNNAIAISGVITSTSPGGSSAAVKGVNNGTGGPGIGVWGVQNGSGFGVYGIAAGAGYGVFGKSSGPGGAGVSGTGNVGALAGNFTGDVLITGHLQVNSGLDVTGIKNFKIDHPLDPENKYLYHSCIESSELMDLYSGNATLDASGEASVTLPDWFEALNCDFRYQLTSIGAPGPSLYIAQKIADHRFRIAGGTPGAEVSWQVTAVRHDPNALAQHFRVEEDKPAKERGTYLDPRAYGKPAQRGVDFASRQRSQAPEKNTIAGAGR